MSMEVETNPQQMKSERNTLLYSEIKQNVSLLEKAVTTIESRYTTRVLRSCGSIRKRLNVETLVKAIVSFFPQDSPRRANLLKQLEVETNAMDVDVAPPTIAASNKDETHAFLPEIELYLCLLVLLYFHDSQQHGKGLELSMDLVNQILSWNRRTLDQIAARIFFYLSRFYELAGRLSEVRSILLAAHRTSSLRHDEQSNATILNLLLRDYLHYNLIDQADKLVSKSVFPENSGNNQLARYYFYLGRIKAIQLNYTASHQYLQQAIRKAPQTDASVGFLQTVQKLSIIVQLLTGEIPERSLFRQPQFKDVLLPYRMITQAVRVGDLAKFQEVLGKYVALFRRDKTYTLILRLRHNVIKAGIRMISLSYSRISLKDICLKLHLDSEEDAEYIVSKAIRDGVIDAVINHEHGFVRSKENIDIYSTNEPQNAFNQRITFCLNLHNDSVKAMRYPSNSHRRHFVQSEEERERDLEIAEEIAKTDFDSDDGEF